MLVLVFIAGNALGFPAIHILFENSGNNISVSGIWDAESTTELRSNAYGDIRVDFYSDMGDNILTAYSYFPTTDTVFSRPAANKTFQITVPSPTAGTSQVKVEYPNGVFVKTSIGTKIGDSYQISSRSTVKEGLERNQFISKITGHSNNAFLLNCIIIGVLFISILTISWFKIQRAMATSRLTGRKQNQQKH